MKQLQRLTVFAWIAMAALGTAHGQTLIDLRSQARSVDFTAASFTRPFKMGVSLPASCLLGELFFKSDAVNGQNLYGCVATNTWSLMGASTTLPSMSGNSGRVLGTNGSSALWQSLGGDASGAITALTVTGLRGRPVSANTPSSGQVLRWSGVQWEPGTVDGGGGGGGASTAAQLTDFMATRVNDTQLLVAAGQGPRFGNTACQPLGPATINVTSGTGTLYVYVLGNCQLIVGHNLTLGSLTGIAGQSPVTAFPANAVPLWQWSVSGGILAASGIDRRAVFSTMPGYEPSRASDTALSLPAVRGNTFRFGSSACSADIPASMVTVGGATGTLWVAMGSDCNVKVRHNAIASCSSGCTAISGASGFEPTDQPLYEWTVQSGVLASTGTSRLTPYGALPLVAGSNIVLAVSGGVTTISATGSSGGSSGSGLADPGSSGLVVRTGTNTTAARTATGTANEITVSNGDGVSGNPTFALASTLDLSGKTSTKPSKTGTTLPSSCSAGETFIKTDATATNQLHICTSTNNWTAQGGSGAVSSVFGRTGAVTAQAGDYTAAQVTGAASTAAANSYKAGAKQSVRHDSTTAGFRVVGEAGDPSTLADGDVWYNSTTGKFRKREGGATSDLDTTGSAGDWLGLTDSTMHFRPNPRQLAILNEEFIGGSTATAGIGELGWRFNNGLLSILNGVAGRPGLVRRDTTTTANTIASLQLSISTGFPLMGPLNNATWRAYFMLRANHTTHTTIRIGFLSSFLGDPPSDGIYFRNISGATPTNWECVTSTSSTETTTATGIALGTGFHTLELASAPGSIEFLIDGQLVCTHTTNISSAVIGPVFQIKNTEAVSKTMDLDAFSFWMKVNR